MVLQHSEQSIPLTKRPKICAHLEKHWWERTRKAFSALQASQVHDALKQPMLGKGVKPIIRCLSFLLERMLIKSCPTSWDIFYIKSYITHTKIVILLLLTCVLVAQSCPTLCNPNGLQPTRLFCPCSSPGKKTEMCSHFLLQGIFLTWDQTQVFFRWSLQVDSLPSEPWNTIDPWIMWGLGHRQ